MSFRQFTPMKAAAISKVGQGPEPPGQWSVRQQENEALAVPLGLLEIKRIGIFNEIDKQLLFLSHDRGSLGREVLVECSAPTLRDPKSVQSKLDAMKGLPLALN